MLLNSFLGAFGGRLDHTFDNMNVLFKEEYRSLEIILIGDGNIVRTLRPQLKYKIITDDKFEGPDCAVIPIKERACVSSQGLQYDMGESLYSLKKLLRVMYLIHCNILLKRWLPREFKLQNY